MARKSKPEITKIQAEKKKILKAAKAEASWWKKQTKILAQEAAKEKAKHIRRYNKHIKQFDLRKELTKSQLRYINAAFEEFTKLTSRPYKVYRSRNKSNLRKVQEVSDHQKGAPKFDVAFVPTADPKNTRIRVNKNQVSIKTKWLTKRIVLFDMEKLAIDPEKEIDKALKEYPNANSYIIKAGEYQYNGGLAPSLVKKHVLNLMARYSPGGSGYTKRGENSYYQNWLFGLEAYFYDDFDDLVKYRKQFQEERLEELSERRRERNRFRKKYGKRINVFKK